MLTLLQCVKSAPMCKFCPNVLILLQCVNSAAACGMFCFSSIIIVSPLNLWLTHFSKKEQSPKATEDVLRALT